MKAYVDEHGWIPEEEREQPKTPFEQVPKYRVSFARTPVSMWSYVDAYATCDELNEGNIKSGPDRSHRCEFSLEKLPHNEEAYAIVCLTHPPLSE